MEHTEDRVLDADIFVNYHTKEIKFENKVKRGNPVTSTLKMMLLLGAAFLLVTLYSAQGFSFPRTVYDFDTGVPTVYQTPWDYYSPAFGVIITVIVIMSLLITLFDIWFSGSNPWLRDRMLDGKRKGVIDSIEIQNPSGTITYKFSGNSAPLIDMEYNDDIADALSETSLVREKEQRKFLKRFEYTRSYMILKIVLSRPATGTLRITEY